MTYDAYSSQDREAAIERSEVPSAVQVVGEIALTDIRGCAEAATMLPLTGNAQKFLGGLLGERFKEFPDLDLPNAVDFVSALIGEIITQEPDTTKEAVLRGKLSIIKLHMLCETKAQTAELLGNKRQNFSEDIVAAHVRVLTQIIHRQGYKGEKLATRLRDFLNADGTSREDI
jgi:hypothetical protein